MLKNIKRIPKYFFILLLPVLLLSLTGCRYLYPVEEGSVPPPLVNAKEITYATYEVQLGTIERYEIYSAIIRSVSTTFVQFEERSGFLRERCVTFNQDVKVGDILMKLDTDSIESEIKRKEIYVKKAYLNLQNAVASGNDTAIKNAQWDYQLAKYDLEDSERAFEKSVIRSPVDGRVSYIAQVFEGSWVDARMTLVTIIDPDHVILEMRGDKVNFIEDSRRVQVNIRRDVYEGTVVMTPQTAPDDIPPEDRNFCWVEIDNMEQLIADGTIKIGDSASIRVVLEERENIIVIPRNLVRNYLGRKYVLVLVNDIQTERDVLVGIETTTSVEIIEGLSVGELLIEK